MTLDGSSSAGWQNPRGHGRLCKCKDGLGPLFQARQGSARVRFAKVYSHGSEWRPRQWDVSLLYTLSVFALVKLFLVDSRLAGKFLTPGVEVIATPAGHYTLSLPTLIQITGLRQSGQTLTAINCQCRIASTAIKFIVPTCWRNILCNLQMAVSTAVDGTLARKAPPITPESCAQAGALKIDRGGILRTCHVTMQLIAPAGPMGDQKQGRPLGRPAARPVGGPDGNLDMRAIFEPGTCVPSWIPEHGPVLFPASSFPRHTRRLRHSRHKSFPGINLYRFRYEHCHQYQR
jgi:hypothetical protein